MPKALVTSGGTIEQIDPVRYISNYSSGKQGFAIAKELVLKGFDVDLGRDCTGKTASAPYGYRKETKTITPWETTNPQEQQTNFFKAANI